MSRTERRLAVVLLPIVALGCASTHMPSAGTGDVSFRVVWKGMSDLDLHVTDPQDNYLSHLRRSSSTGGILDIDCNGDRICDVPIENVYWPEGEAPRGLYRVWVKAHRLHEGESPLSAKLSILRGREVAWEQPATFTRRNEVFGPFTYSYEDGPSSPPVIEEQVGWTGTWSCMTDSVFVGGLQHVLILEAAKPEVVDPSPTARAELKRRPLSSFEQSGSALSFAIIGEGGWTTTFKGTVDGNILTGVYSPPEGPVVAATCVSVGPARTDPAS